MISTDRLARIGLALIAIAGVITIWAVLLSV